jgi:hypothetical protein
LRSKISVLLLFLGSSIAAFVSICNVGVGAACFEYIFEGTLSLTAMKQVQTNSFSFVSATIASL